MKSKLEQDEQVGLSDHVAQVAYPQKTDSTDAKMEVVSGLPKPKVSSNNAGKEAQLVFGDATIIINAPSIIINTTSISEDTTNDVSGVSDKYKEDVCNSFEKYEERQEKLIAASYEKADGLLLTISSSILALSATFIGTLLANKHSLRYLCQLRTGWVSLGLTVAFVLVSYFASRKSLSHAVESARSSKNRCLSEDDNEKKRLDEEAKHYNNKREISRKLTEFFNLAATATFIVGLALIVIFAVMNIR